MWIFDGIELCKTHKACHSRNYLQRVLPIQTSMRTSHKTTSCNSQRPSQLMSTDLLEPRPLHICWQIVMIVNNVARFNPVVWHVPCCPPLSLQPSAQLSALPSPSFLPSVSHAWHAWAEVNRQSAQAFNMLSSTFTVFEAQVTCLKRQAGLRGVTSLWCLQVTC